MKEANRTTLGSLVKWRRQAAGLSVYGLAKRAGLDRTTVLRLEAGEVKQLSRTRLNALARALAIEPEELYDALWEDAEQPLPSVAGYFRSKYRLNAAQIAEVEASVRRVTGQDHPSPPSSKKN